MSGTKRGGDKKSQRRIRSVCAPRSFSSMFVLIVADRCSPPLEAGAGPLPPPPPSRIDLLDGPRPRQKLAPLARDVAAENPR